MLPITCRAIYIKREAADDPRSVARIDRMLPFVYAPAPPQVIGDAELNDLIASENLNQIPRNGRIADDVEPIVIFNQYLYHHTEEERRARRQQYPDLFKAIHYGGYGGWDWRPSGSPGYREATGLVCQPAYAIHSFWGCHFRCTYCRLGHVSNIFVNLEDWIHHLREGLGDMELSPQQRIFQWDNGTDIVCFEPEYGGTKLLVDLFAEQADRCLLLYVGKSDHVDFMLDYDHRGHTTCCWSLSTETQTNQVELRTASLEDRLKSARKCQEAGYGVRIRFSPIVPVAGWQDEVRSMINRMFDEIQPEVITIEPLRFHTYDDLVEDYEPGFLDPEYLESMKAMSEAPDPWQHSQFPSDLRLRIYRTVLDEVAKRSPETPVALCREKREIWDTLSLEFDRMGQHPDDYVCNCGPFSAQPDPRLVSSV